MTASALVSPSTISGLCIVFDRKLRGLVTEGTKSVEISVRSRWAYEIGHHYGPLAYENPANFNNPKIHKETLERIDRELVRTRDETILHFRMKHQMPGRRSGQCAR